MIDNPVNLEELEARKKQNEAAEIATDDGMPVGPDSVARAPEAIQYTLPRQWTRAVRKFPGLAGPLSSRIRRSSIAQG